MSAPIVEGRVYEFQARRVRIEIDVTIRRCRQEDLLELEWGGAYTPHRELIREAYEQQRHGELLMLVADLNGRPIGQIWIDLQRKRRRSVAVLWALRVLPYLQRLGVGTRLIEVAEQAAVQLGFRTAELDVEPHNHGARRLYERLGYRFMATEQHVFRFTAPDGAPLERTLPVHVLHKRL